MWLSDFRLILKDRIIEHGSLHIVNGKIADIVEHPMAGGIAGDGLTIMPGFIDMHGDMIEMELEPRPNVHFPMEVALTHLDARLAAAGVTTAYAAVSFSRGRASKNVERRSFEHTSKVIRQLHAMRDKCRVDHKIHARFDITFDNAVGVLADLIRDEQVDLVSLMNHTPGQGQYRDIERHIKHVAKSRKISEDEARLSVRERMEKGGRPEEEILHNIDQVAKLCRAHHVALASHDDDTPEKANLMADIGSVIAEFPVTMEAAQVTASRGLMNAMGAPNAMRGMSYSGNLSAREAHAAGLLHILAADYHPAAILHAILILAESDPAGLPGAVTLASANPAQALGLSDRGELAVGLRADLAIIEHHDSARTVATLSEGEVIYSTGLLSGLYARGRSAA